ncbi:MAG: LPS export ABC transporter periplasmic protein LptC [Chitinophagales bacterium]
MNSRYSFLTLIFVALMMSCSPDLQEAKEIEEVGQKIMSEHGDNVEIIQTDKGNPTLRITANKVIRYEAEEPYMEFPEGMSIYVYGEEGEVESVLNADYGKMSEGSTEMIAENNVVVVNSTGEQLNTEHLVWDSEAQKIRSEGYVKISTPTEIIYGTRFEADENFTNYQIDSVIGTVTIKEGEF